LLKAVYFLRHYPSR